ncbi:MAG TPA: hypothetical protein VIV60_02565 [Polyangiaceae bacterium]
MDLNDGRIAMTPDCNQSRALINDVLDEIRAKLALQLPEWCRSKNPADSNDAAEQPCSFVGSFNPGERRDVEYPAKTGTYVSVVVSGGTLGLHAHKFELGSKVNCAVRKFETHERELIGSLTSIRSTHDQHPWISLRATGCLGVLIGRRSDTQRSTAEILSQIGGLVWE